MKPLLLFACSVIVPVANAQWQMLDSHTTADLHGIDAVTEGVAWASGTNGTVLRTEDGHTWQTCAVPQDGAGLDFTTVQGFDEKTALVMSNGNGSLSRLYKTKDGCRSWTRVFENPHATGSFESLHRVSGAQMYLLGDPVDGKLTMYASNDIGNTWAPYTVPGLDVPKGAGPVSGTASVTNVDWLLTFGTAGKDAVVYTFTITCKTTPCSFTWVGKPTPLGKSSANAGASSVAGRTYAGAALPGITGDVATSLVTTLIAVGGDPSKPDANLSVAAVSTDSGNSWKPSSMQPGGYRSAVAFDSKHERFIAVGPNGTDVSSDDGVSWVPMTPGPGDVPAADKQWNSISLPYVVGPHGRIGELKATGTLRAQNSR